MEFRRRKILCLISKRIKSFICQRASHKLWIIPKTNYIAVRGKGNPNEEGGAYQQAIGVLYAVATLKMSYKGDYKIEGFLNMFVTT